MGSVAYSSVQKAEAVALAAIVGVEAAAEQLGMQVRTLRGWANAAGQRPDVDSDAWQKLHDLAMAKTMAAVASGKLRPRDVAVIAGISKRNLSKPVPVPERSSVEAREQFIEWLVERVSAEPIPLDIITSEAAMTRHLEALSLAIREMERHLLRVANEEARVHDAARGRPSKSPTGHRRLILAWFSERTEIPADDVLEWAKARVDAVYAEHGDILSWYAAMAAEREAERLAIQRARELARPPVDPEVQALIAEAEGYLAQVTHDPG